MKFIEERSLFHYSQNKSSASAEDDEKIQNMKKNKEKFELLSQAVSRHTRHDPNRFYTLKYDENKKTYKSQLEKFCFYLINQIEDKDWKSIFEATIPAIKQSSDILNAMLPYLIYYSMRFN